MDRNLTAYPHLYKNGSSLICVSDCSQHENCTSNCLDENPKEEPCLTLIDSECGYTCGYINMAYPFKFDICYEERDKRKYPHLYTSNGKSVCVSECPPDLYDGTCILNCDPYYEYLPREDNDKKWEKVKSRFLIIIPYLSLVMFFLSLSCYFLISLYQQLPPVYKPIVK